MPPNCGLSEVPTPKGTVTRKSFPLKPSTSMLSMLRMGGGGSQDAPAAGTEVFEVELSAIPGGDDEIPVVVTLCIAAIERKGGLEMEGLYRVPGIKGEIEKLKLHFSYGRPNLDDEEWSDINAIAGVLKLWFRQLPGSLLTQQLFDEFIVANDTSKPESQRVQQVKAVLGRLPRRNFNVLKYLVIHLNRVAEKGGLNKMFSENLATVFGPSLMRSPREDDIGTMTLQCGVIELILKNSRECFDL